jgi:TonB family protein
MSPEPCGSQLLLELFSKTSTGVVYKALPLDGLPELRLVLRFDENLARLPEVDRTVRRHAKQWQAVRDINALNLLETAKPGEPLWWACEYRQGRLLSDVLERCKHEGIPLAVDQSVYLAERLAGALLSAATQDLSHGCMTPEWILVTFEGEVKILPGLCKDLLTSHPLEGTAAEVLRRYQPAPPEGAGLQRNAADIYAVGALLFEFLVHEPFFTGAAGFDPANRLEEAKKGEGSAEGLPANLHGILRRSLLQGTPEAYANLAALKSDLDQLITSGEYSPTTFNIAFLMHSLFRGEDEAESNADQALVQLDRTPFKPKPAPREAPAERPPLTRPTPPTPAVDAPTFGVEPEPSRKGLYIGIGAAAIVIVMAVLGYFAFLKPRGPSQAEIQAQEELRKLQAQQAEMAQRMKSLEDERNQLAQQVTSAKTDEERAKAKKALEDAQKKIDAQKEEQARLAAASPAPAKPPSPGPASVPPSPAASAPQPATAAPAGQSPQPQPGGSPPPPQPSGGSAPPPAESEPSEPPKVKPGDFVELWAVDLKPQRQGDLKVTVTPAARSNRLSGTIYVEVTIDETGKVVDSKVVRGLNPDYGMNDVCREAASRLKYTPAVKEGVPVKTKMTFPIMIK